MIHITPDALLREGHVPFAIKHANTPRVTTHSQKQALHALLPIQNHLKSTGGILGADLCLGVCTCPVNDTPKRPREFSHGVACIDHPR